MHEFIQIHHETEQGEKTFHVIFERIASASPTDENDTFEYIDILDDDGALSYMSEKEFTAVKEAL